ncbi:MAG: GAF domain-containing protein [Okeania sp. SIO3I5]|uniref:GAF domain-containing sensor histidine kinase n=1 Tax=Okeania sp. SIO3I5 TaxID=2607805 RepID=UPI0013BC5A03|nr:GAF domain-containing protein [Okeania sp. SIO3I5]NEQ34822.1 GAF domain-containing protein [Okeania sp. SIO3I5]
MSEQNTEYQTLLGEAIQLSLDSTSIPIPISQEQETIFKTQLTELRKLLKTDRVALLRFYPDLDGAGEFVYEDLADGWNSILNLKVENNCFPDYQKEGTQAVADIDVAKFSESHAQILREFQIKADLVVPVLKQDDATEAILPELWGLLCIHQCGSSRKWHDLEIKFAQKTAENLAVMIRNIQLLETADYQVEQQKTLARVIKRVRATLDLEEIFQVTATEVRQLLKADRVAVFRFYPEKDWEGEIVSEDVADEWESALGAVVHDHCFGGEYSIYYQKGRVQATTDIYAVGLKDCHITILERFQVRANLVVPLLKSTEQGELPELWGLLCIHQCSNPRHWQYYEIDFVQQIADHFGLALQQEGAFKNLEEKAIQLTISVEQQKALARVIKRIRITLDLQEIFQVTATEVRQLLKADRVAVFRFYPERDWEGEIVSEDVANEWESTLGVEVYDYCFGTNFAVDYQKGRVQAVADIYAAGLSDCHIKILERFQVRANLVVPLLKSTEQGEIPELWGLLCIHQCSKPRYWQYYEIDFVQQIADHFGVALQQEDVFKQVERQAAELAMSREKEKSAERQKIVGELFDKIRRSLDIETIFATATQEARKLLQAERVTIYQFLPDWSGEFIAESFAEGWTPLVGVQPIIKDTFLEENQGGRYANNETFAVDDIYQVGHDPCHIELLEEFGVKAYVIAPILQGEKLWGLLASYQNSSSRDWQKDEVDLLAQIATQLGVAVQQAEYIQTVQEQSKQAIRAAAMQKSAERQKTLVAIVDKIRQSLDIETIFETTTQQVQKLLNADRVAIYQFNSDWSGEFVAESVAEGWNSLILEQQENPEIKTNISQCSVQDFANTHTDTYLQETEGGPFTKGLVYRVCNDIYNAGFSDCYIKALESYQAKSYGIIAIYQGEKLWGLLAAFQNSGPRDWQKDEVELLAQIGTQLGVALQQAEYVRKVQEQSTQLAIRAVAMEKSAERQKTLAAIVDKIRRSLDIKTIFQTTTQEVQQLLDADRVAIFRFHADWSGEFVAESVAEGWEQLIHEQQENPRVPANVNLCSVRDLPNYVNDTYLQETKGENFAAKVYRSCNDIYERGFSDCYLEVLESYQVRAYAIVAIYQGEKLWGLLAAYQNSGPREWEAAEVEVLAQIGGQLGVALQQAEYFKQVQAQAAELEKATERQKALSITIDRIRQSLDINKIFQATTQEVLQLLEVERVAIYRFYSDWSGEFVADSIIDEWNPIVETPLEINPVLRQQTHASKLPRNETFVPILQGEKLWGLLVAYQNSSPRYWQDEEINLLAQVGVQLGIALQQAELLEKTRTQAEDLTKALQELKQTQMQMIQGEKMAGLGQLVAGMAHEINNPVNFIYGNLNYVEEYTKNLLDLIKLYSEHSVNPVPEIQDFIEDIDLEFMIQDLPKTMNSIKVGSERIRQLVFSLRTFSRLDEAEMKAVDLHQGIDSTLLILQHRFEPKHAVSQIEVVKNYGNLPLVKCHAAQINQAFMNLISNAIDILEEKLKVDKYFSPTIKITTEISSTNPDSVLIKIADNGLGIPPEVKEKIFNLFFTTKDIGKGTGLGLAISYEIIVQKHGGKLLCNSEVNQGTEFILEIPILPQKQASLID